MKKKAMNLEKDLWNQTMIIIVVENLTTQILKMGA